MGAESPAPPVALRGPLSAAVLRPFLKREHPPAALDLAGITHFELDGLRVLAALARRLHRHGKRLQFHHAPPALAALLSFICFDLIADFPEKLT